MHALYVDRSFYDPQELLNVRDLLNHPLSPYYNSFCDKTLLSIDSN